MPIYEYECSGCSHKFEMKRKFNETGAVPCPNCGCETQRLFSPTPIIFKGSGFYVTDYRKSTPGDTPPADSKGEVKASK